MDTIFYASAIFLLFYYGSFSVSKKICPFTFFSFGEMLMVGAYWNALLDFFKERKEMHFGISRSHLNMKGRNSSVVFYHSSNFLYKKRGKIYFSAVCSWSQSSAFHLILHVPRNIQKRRLFGLLKPTVCTMHLKNLHKYSIYWSDNTGNTYISWHIVVLFTAKPFIPFPYSYVSLVRSPSNHNHFHPAAYNPVFFV